MSIIELICIVFACTAANHLGLVQAIEIVTVRSLYVVNCPKCFSFWAVFAYSLWCVGVSDIPLAFAVSFLSSWSAVWLDLLMGIMDYLYQEIYDKIYPATNTNNAYEECSVDTVS